MPFAHKERQMETEYVIYHLTSAEYFDNLPADKPYLPREFDRDGFIHCTKGEERLLLVADTVYRRVPGDFLLLAIDERKVTAPVKYENVGGILFPHIYGPLNREAIVRVVKLGRREDGTFLPFGEPDAAADNAVMTDAWLAQARIEQLLAESAELRARTMERIAQIERAILALQTPVAVEVKPAARPAASTPAVAPAPAPMLEARIERLEAEIANIKSQISKLKKTAQPPRKKSVTRKRK
jgi:uncharacterized protein (DUF952 family)